MIEDRVNAGVKQQNFQLAAGCRVPPLIGLQQAPLAAGGRVLVTQVQRILTPFPVREQKKRPPYQGTRGDGSRFHSLLSLETAHDAGQAEGFHIPRAPGRTSQLPPQARFQPVTRPLCPLEHLLLFPINTLFKLPLYLIRISPKCQEGTSVLSITLWTDLGNHRGDIHCSSKSSYHIFLSHLLYIFSYHVRKPSSVNLSSKSAIGLDADSMISRHVFTFLSISKVGPRGSPYF